MQPAVRLREKLVGSTPVVGALVSSHLWLDLIEVALQAGLDYLIIDTEHFDHGAPLVADACSLARRAGFPVLLRPSRTDTESIRIAMDLGPCGLLLPMIESAEQLDGVRDGLFLPPRGRRRPGGPANRWVQQYDYQTFRREVEDTLIIVPQIESRLGVSNVAAIAAHPIVTALGIGPFDLSADLGVCWEPKNPKFLDAIQAIRSAADAAGKPFWMVGDVLQLVNQGVRFVCAGDPVSLMQQAFSQLAAAAHGAPSPAGDVATATREDETRRHSDGNGKGHPYSLTAAGKNGAH